ncbi:hypothetical protein DAPPUDRAFT_112248 [Daphnia pulex]|uniref:Uncharacterized protein n=1 Tax=Daphnia pulex TaxID=6669 RepID=E9HBD8_DAPPU|nr:hypothetical protein DAPPUDRAFT_112248 [Daphnia pulex]|eukprot:EFX70947.1 hypothetical protein DAPPUDRAFT_112248 [Daphnia pulex]
MSIALALLPTRLVWDGFEALEILLGVPCVNSNRCWEAPDETAAENLPEEAAVENPIESGNPPNAAAVRNPPDAVAAVNESAAAALRGCDQDPERCQRADRDRVSVGAGRNDAEPGRGEHLPPADNLLDLEWEILDDPEWARRLKDMFDRQTAQHLRRRDNIIERLQQDRLRRQQQQEILFEQEIAMMEVKEENIFLLYNPAAFRKENNGVDDGICTVYLENQADHSLRL